MGDLTAHILLEGEVHVHVPELGCHNLVGGDWLLLSDRGGHTTFHAKGPIEGTTVWISRNKWQALSQLGLTMPWNLRCLECIGRDAAFLNAGRCCDRIRSIARSIQTEPARTVGESLRQTARIHELLGTIFERPELQTGTEPARQMCERDRRRVQAVAAFLKANISLDHTLSDLARRHYLNECKLKACFKQHFGTTVFGYLRECRMAAAKDLLHGGEASVLAVANAVGYTNASQFARAFRAQHGCNPSKVR